MFCHSEHAKYAKQKQRSGNEISLSIVYLWQPVVLVRMVQTALTNATKTATAVTDLLEHVTLDVNLDGKE